MTIKIAVVNYKKIGKFLGGQEKAVETIVKSLRNSSKLSPVIKVFSFGEKNESTKVFGGIEQQVVKGVRYDEETFSSHRIFDFLHLAFFGSKSSLERLNKNTQMLKRIGDFAPDLIVTVTSNLYGLLSTYKLEGGTAKVISYLDSPRLIEDSFLAIESVNAPRLTKRILKKTLWKRYARYYERTYLGMAGCSDAIVVASVQDRAELIGLVGERYRKMTFIAPPIMVDKRLGTKSRSGRKSVKTVLFLGTYAYFPNAEAISIIKNSIAPSLPGKTFIIVGRGGVNMLDGNVRFMGDVEDIHAVISKADVCIAPLMRGSGMKQKILEYFMAGKPVIGTSLAFNGYDIRDGIDAIVENDPDKFHLRIKDLDSDPMLMRRLSVGSKKIVTRFMIANLRRKWEEIVEFIR